MVHQVGFWYKLMNLKIPHQVMMSGANYLSPDMQLPDTMDVAMLQPEKLVFNWNSMFGNNLFGEGDDELLGNKGTIFRDENENVKYAPQGGEGSGATAPKAVRAADIVGGGDMTVAHMQNFFDCVRSRKEPNCPFDLGFRSAVACQMAITSYRKNRPVRWDEKLEGIV
jgi:hypothetical protein